jgi:hypothetical protein
MTTEQTEPNNGATDDALPTALEVAHERSQYSETPLTAEFLTELRRPLKYGTKRNWSPAILRDGRAVQTTPATVWAILQHEFEPVCSPEEIEKLKDLQARMDATLKKAEKFSLTNIPDYLNQRRDEIHAAALNGSDVSDAVVESREEVHQTFVAKQRALLAVVQKLYDSELVPLVKPILKRFEQRVDTFLHDMEASDIVMCAAFGLDFQPSLVWQAGAAIAMQYADGRSMPTNYGTPKQILAGIVEL